MANNRVVALEVTFTWYVHNSKWEDDRCLHVALLYDIRYKCQLNLSMRYESNHCYSHWMCSAWGGS